MSTEGPRARVPFRFVDYEGLVVATGWEARNLRELVDVLRRVGGDVDIRDRR